MTTFSACERGPTQRRLLLETDRYHTLPGNALAGSVAILRIAEQQTELSMASTAWVRVGRAI